MGGLWDTFCAKIRCCGAAEVRLLRLPAKSCKILEEFRKRFCVEVAYDNGNDPKQSGQDLDGYNDLHVGNGLNVAQSDDIV